MRAVARFLVFALPAVLLIAESHAWESKHPSEWNEKDIQQLLADSPWAKTVPASLLPELTEAQRQDGGATGGGRGAGLKALAGVSLTGISGPMGERSTSSRSPTREVVNIRWESALPIRLAELKAGESGIPENQAGEFLIGIYQVPGLQADGKKMAGELKKAAGLLRDGEKDLKPTRVEVIAVTSNRSKVFYFFSRSSEISRKDKHVTFVAQIGRLCIQNYFDLEEMTFQSKLEL